MSGMAFEPIKKQKIAEQVAGAIRKAIVRGHYKPGDNLPSERDLAGQFGVNRSSIREALLRLEAWGVVKIRQGGGTKVRDVFYSAGLQILPYLLAPDGRIDGALLADVLAIRVMFLTWTAEQAAKNADDASVAELRAVLARLEAAKSARETLQEDFAFYEQLVVMADNKVMTLFVNAMREIYLHNSEHLIFIYAAQPFDTADHRRAVEAIAAGDEDAAGRAMKAYGERVLTLGAEGA